MKATVLYEGKSHQWIVFGRDPEKSPSIIDTNQFMVMDDNNAVLLDPGGIELFAPMLAAVTDWVDIDNIRTLFASHQDPDIISSLGLWDRTLTDATLYAPWVWESFLKHFGCSTITYSPLPDEGDTITVGNMELTFVPAHYLHSSGNFNVYDATSKILMSGDIGAALLPPDAPLFVEDFDAHISKMKLFHQRWMPSNKAKNDWVQRVRKLDIEYMAPQHGAIFAGDLVPRFLDWFEALEVGIAVEG
ncbi:MBL fold metallo-hydrolase [Hwanghaeella grinnelliae]|uniref:MBL fold metallo-hydrolase n=2 Tax=Hwanghaeella grinnelliae TaxID=2500179 RepID=A0A3S2W7B2_9PROT|nr:MBL fold metallo-hydrolase [Hwanghaeella grinnelliae]